MSENLTPTVRIEKHENDELLTVRLDYEHAGVDLPCMFGWSVPNMKMALRLKAAIEAGVVVKDQCIKTNVNGKTYVATTVNVMGRYMNSDLKKLGY